MTSSVELVINLENPCCNVQILCNKLCQRVNEFLFVVNIHTAYWCRHISQLEDFLGSRFSGIKMLFWRFSTENWNCQSDRKFDIINGRCTWNNKRLFPLNQVFHLLQSLWAINQNLSEREMMRESIHVIWNQNMKTALRVVNLPNFKNFHVIP